MAEACPGGGDRVASVAVAGDRHRLNSSIPSAEGLGVEVGDGFALARVPGSKAHDEILATDEGVRRVSGRAGGTEGGLSTGEPLRGRAAMRPIATVPQALATVDVATGAAATAHHQRSDVCAVPAAGIAAEAMVALVRADAVVEKFGGDSVPEARRNIRSCLDNLRVG